MVMKFFPKELLKSLLGRRGVSKLPPPKPKKGYELCMNWNASKNYSEIGVYAFVEILGRLTYEIKQFFPIAS